MSIVIWTHLIRHGKIPYMNKEQIIKSLIVLCFLFVLAGFLGAYWKNNSQPIACPADAMQCPDGSFIGRIGPKCEFSACPQTALNTYSDSAITFQYANINKTYITGNQWPPKVTVEKSLNCGASSTQRFISGKTFCVGSSSEGAAGSTYTTYDYISVIDQKNVNFEFVLQFPQCANYDDPKKTECMQERESFNPDALMTPIAATFKFL